MLHAPHNKPRILCRAPLEREGPPADTILESGGFPTLWKYPQAPPTYTSPENQCFNLINFFFFLHERIKYKCDTLYPKRKGLGAENKILQHNICNEELAWCDLQFANNNRELGINCVGVSASAHTSLIYRPIYKSVIAITNWILIFDHLLRINLIKK